MTGIEFVVVLALGMSLGALGALALFCYLTLKY